jgi:hypothetical protein
VKRRILGSTVAKAIIHASDELRVTSCEMYFLSRTKLEKIFDLVIDDHFKITFFR